MKWGMYMQMNPIQSLNDLYEDYIRDPLKVDSFALELRNFIRATVKAECRRKSASTYDTVEDAVGESLLKVWGHLGDFKPGECLFTTWVTTIVLNNITDIWRKYNKRREIGLVENWNGSVQLRIGDKIDCFKLLTQLKEADRSFIIKKLNGLTDDELAAHFGQNRQWAWNKWYRLKEKLRVLAATNV